MAEASVEAGDEPAHAAEVRSEGLKKFSSRSMTKGNHSDTATRHYPVDLPDLPFERYEHRRLTARDLLVNRIMAQIMSPAQNPANAHLLSSSATRPVGFAGLKFGNPHLRADLQLLRKMLFTSSAREPELRKKCEITVFKEVIDNVDVAWDFPYTRTQTVSFKLIVDGPWVPRATVEELALDLVRRHYIEQDDPALRLWLQARRPPLPTPSSASPGAAQTHNRATAPGSRARVVKYFNDFQEATRKTEHKTWLGEDTVLLRSLQAKTRTAQANFLFDGGAFLPALRQPMLANVHAQYRFHLFSLHHMGYALEPAWPGERTTVRCMRFPQWEDGHERWQGRMELPSSYNSTMRAWTDRELGKDSSYSTIQWSDDTLTNWPGRRSRKRAASEPPPAAFTAARLAWLIPGSNDNLLFPKLSLATLDRRSRRRSLSRTRISEMFDWNLVPRNPASKSPPGVTSRQTPNRWYSSLNKDQRGSKIPKIQRPALDIASEGELSSVRVQVLADECADDGHPYSILATPNGIHSSTAAKVIRPILLNPRDSGESPVPLLCANCCSKNHTTSRCHLPCGYCGAPNPEDMSRLDINGKPVAGMNRESHIAPQCPVAPTNRCKCGPFPMFHVAAKCQVTCSRPCGDIHATGSFKHRNAMGCKSRCCMCGIKGHSGSQCKLKKCRCGNRHLGQDCGWKPECRVPGCTRYLCGIHCAACGREKGKGGLVAGHCQMCLQNPSLGRSSDTIEVSSLEQHSKRGRTRMRKEKQLNGQELTKDANIRPMQDAEGHSWLPFRPRSNAKTKT